MAGALLSQQRLDRRIGRLLALLFALFYLGFAQGRFMGSDEVGLFETTRAMYENGDLVVPPVVHAWPGPDGRYRSVFAVGQAILALPLYGLAQAGAAILPERWVELLAGRQAQAGALRFGGTLEISAVVGLYGAIIGGLLVGLFYRLGRALGVSVRSAVLAAALLGATTYVAGMSVYFLRHTTEALLILGAFYNLRSWRSDGAISGLAVGTLLASATILVRVPAAVSIPVLALYALPIGGRPLRDCQAEILRPRVLAAAGLPAIAVACLHMAVNYAKWGTLLASPMLRQSAEFYTPLLEGLHGLLLSPGASLFVFSPLLILAPWTLRLLWQTHRSEALTIAGLCLAFLLLSAKFTFWHGLWSAPGPRMIFVCVPLLMVPLGLWLDAATPRRLLACVVPLALVGGVVQVLLLTVSWANVLTSMNYPAYEPLGAFLFEAAHSTIVGYLQVFLEGRADGPWLFWLARSSPDGAGAPMHAFALGTAWLLCAGACLLRLRWVVGQATTARS